MRVFLPYCASEILSNDFIMDSPDDLSIVEKIESLLKDQVSLKEQMKRNRFKSQEFSMLKNLESTLDIVQRFGNF